MTILPLFLFFGLIYVIWHNETHAREGANQLALRLCADQEVQLLDQTVARDRTRLVWRARALRIERTYRFEYTSSGEERMTGFFCLSGQHALWADFEETRIWFH